MKLALQGRIGVRVPVGSPIFAWFCEHAADSLNRSEIGRDGKTVYQRVWGRRSQVAVAELGESPRFRFQGAERAREGRLAPRWGEGVWLGVRWATNQHIVWSEGRIRFSRSIRRKTNSERWGQGNVMEVNLRPLDLTAMANDDDEVDQAAHERTPDAGANLQPVPEEDRVLAEQEAEEVEYRPRRAMVQGSDVRRWPPRPAV